MKMDANEAFQRLLAAKSFGDGWSGHGEPTWEAIAFDSIFRNDDPTSLFERLVWEGNLAGQLYGLCGLHLTSPSRYQNEAKRFRGSSQTISYQTGDLIGGATVAAIIEDIEGGTFLKMLLAYARYKEPDRDPSRSCPYCHDVEPKTIEDFDGGGSHWCKKARAYVFVCRRCASFYSVMDGPPIVRALRSLGRGTHDCREIADRG